MTNKAFCAPKEHDLWTNKIVAAYLPVCKTFLQKFFRKHRASDDQMRIANGLCDALVQFWGEGAKTPSEQDAVAQVLYVMDQREISGNEGTNRLLKTLLQAARMNLAVTHTNHKAAITLSDRVQALYPSFRINFRTRVNSEAELTEIVAVCRNHPRAVSVITHQLTAFDADRSMKRRYIQVLQVCSIFSVRAQFSVRAHASASVCRNGLRAVSVITHQLTAFDAV